MLASPEGLPSRAGPARVHAVADGEKYLCMGDLVSVDILPESGQILVHGQAVGENTSAFGAWFLLICFHKVVKYLFVLHLVEKNTCAWETWFLLIYFQKVVKYLFRGKFPLVYAMILNLLGVSMLIHGLFSITSCRYPIYIWTLAHRW